MLFQAFNGGGLGANVVAFSGPLGTEQKFTLDAGGSLLSYASGTLPVKKGDKYKITSAGATITGWFLPVGI